MSLSNLKPYLPIAFLMAWGIAWAAGGNYNATLTYTLGNGGKGWCAIEGAYKGKSSVARVGHTMATPGTSATLTITANYTATTGNTLVVGCTGYKSGGTTGFTALITDTALNTYTEDKAQLSANQKNSEGHLFHSFSVTGGALVFTCTVNTTLFLNLFILEYSNTNNATDGFVSAAGTADTLDSGTLTTTADPDVIIGLFADNNAGAVTFTAGAGQTIVDSSLNGACCQVAAITERITAAASSAPKMTLLGVGN